MHVFLWTIRLCRAPTRTSTSTYSHLDTVEYSRVRKVSAQHTTTRHTTTIHQREKDLRWDRRCSAAVIDFLRATEIDRRYRERGQEEDDPGGGGWKCRVEVAMR
jgi:hypothetical protein